VVVMTLSEAPIVTIISVSRFAVTFTTVYVPEVERDCLTPIPDRFPAIGTMKEADCARTGSLALSPRHSVILSDSFPGPQKLPSTGPPPSPLKAAPPPPQVIAASYELPRLSASLATTMQEGAVEPATLPFDRKLMSSLALNAMLLVVSLHSLCPTPTVHVRAVSWSWIMRRNSCPPVVTPGLQCTDNRLICPPNGRTKSV